MSKIVHIPKIGHVEFPDEMDDGAITQAAGDLHSNARNEGISKFMGEDPAVKGLPHSQKLKEMSTIAGLMEKYPRLADAVDKGIDTISQAGAQNPSGPSNTDTQRKTT